jgi:hypothetical protein
MTTPKRSPFKGLSVGPLLAESGLSLRANFGDLNDRFREKRTSNIACNAYIKGALGTRVVGATECISRPCFFDGKSAPDTGDDGSVNAELRNLLC